MKINTTIKTLGALLCASLFSFSMSATTRTVVSTTDNTIGSLRAVVDSSSSGDTILFHGTTNGISQVLTGEIAINKSLYIFGNGTTNTLLDGNNVGRIFNITNAATVNITGAAITNGSSATSGGGIAIVNTDVTLNNCDIKWCTATGNSSAEGGGGISSQNGILSINNCLIANNTASGTSGRGGGIYTLGSGDLVVRNSLVRYNTSGSGGGGIAADNDGSLTLDHSDISNNNAGTNPGNGGGVYATGGGSGDFIIKSSTIVNNIADGHGGGVWMDWLSRMDSSLVENNASGAGGGGLYLQNNQIDIFSSTVSNNSATDSMASGGGAMVSGILVANNSKFNSNSARRNGGGLYQNDTYGALILRQCNVDSNMAGPDLSQGGGIYVEGSDGDLELTGGTCSGNTATGVGGGVANIGHTLIIDGTKINDNTGPGGGGGIYLNSGRAWIDNAIIRGNTALGPAKKGGGILNTSSEPLAISNCIISNNSSRYGGGIMDQVGSSSLSIQNSSIDSNSAVTGAGINVSRRLNLVSGTVSYNNASNEAGGIFSGATSIINGTEVNHNTAAGNKAGGIYNDGNLTLTNNASVSHNSALGLSSTGGGIYGGFATILNISHTTLNGNTATAAGGAIWESASSRSRIDITYSNFENNIVTGPSGNGGAIRFGTFAVINITHSNFNNNTVAGQGGAIWNDRGDMYLRYSTFANNSVTDSTGLGGAIYDNRGTGIVMYSTVSGNSSRGYGGGLYINGSWRLRGSTVANNTAGLEGGGVCVQASASSNVELQSSLVADNTAGTSGQDLASRGAGTFSTLGFNLIENDDQAVFALGTGDIENQDPNLLPLADNGGLTETHALGCPSVAVDAGDSTLAINDQIDQPIFGGFRDIGAFELQQACVVDTGSVVKDSLTIVSNSSWMKSTVSTPSNYSGSWSGVGGVLPPDGTFTLSAIEGQPYSFNSIDSIDGATVIKTDNNITYYRKSFNLDTLQNFEARFRLFVDDQAEVYINGELVVAQYTGGVENYKLPAFDALFNNDNTVSNPNSGGDLYDLTTGMNMDNIFKRGVNTVTIAVRNKGKASDLGGFTFRLDICGEKSSGSVSPPVVTMGSLVSNSSFQKSTTATTSNYSGFWGGVSSLPATSTYTLPAVEGQPYSFNSIDAVTGSNVITTESNNIVYYRKEFDLTTNINVSARFRMTVDNGMEIYVNGQLIVREENISQSNFKAPSHDVLFNANGTVDNGFMGGDLFDYTTTATMDNIFNNGTNEVVIVVRNMAKASDRGGFSFSMEVEANGNSVIVDDKKSAEAKASVSKSNLQVEIYPNPTSGIVNVNFATAGYELVLFDMNGKLLKQQTANEQNTILNISQFPSGIYFLTVKSGDKVYTQKVVKQ